MNAASLQKAAGTPAAGASTAAASQKGAAGGVTPMDGQGFVPVAASPVASGDAAASDGSIPAEQALQALMQVLGDELSEPIIAADGTVYMEKKKPGISNGAIALSYVVVGKIDKATGRMKINPAILEKVKAKSEGGAEPTKKLVKIDDQYVWQTFTKDANGKTVVSDIKAATEQELAAYQQQVQTQQAQQAAQAKLQNRGDWQQKIGVVAQHLGLFGSAGQLVSGLSGGPNPFTGKPGASWISGWILAQRLNGKAEGKLLPKFMQTGTVATALEWGIQAYGMLDLGNDIRVVRDFLNKAKPLPAVNPGAVELLAKQGHHLVEAQALAGLGAELRTNGVQLVKGTGNAAILNTKLGAVQLVEEGSLHKAFAATDPIQDAGLKLRGNIDGGVAKGLGMLKGLVQPAMMGATALGLVSSVITVKNMVEKNGKGVLLDTQQGRGALLGALSSAAFLGLYTLPMILPGLGLAAPAVAAAASAVNIVSNVMGGVQMLNSYGLFGDNGFLNNDALRAAFLIPPLTPIGAFAFMMKSRKKKQEAEAAKLEAAQKLAVERITQQREMAKLQLQSAGQVSGGIVGNDGTITVATNVPNDLSKLAGTVGGSAAPPASSGGASAPAPAASSAENAALAQQRQQLTMTAKPMR